MSDTPDLFARAAEQLRSAANPDEGDTIVVATLNAGRMVMQTRTPRGPGELVHIARRLLEEARDAYDEIADGPGDAAVRAAAEDAAVDIGDAIEAITDAEAGDDQWMGR